MRTRQAGGHAYGKGWAYAGARMEQAGAGECAYGTGEWHVYTVGRCKRACVRNKHAQAGARTEQMGAGGHVVQTKQQVHMDKFCVHMAKPAMSTRVSTQYAEATVCACVCVCVCACT